MQLKSRVWDSVEKSFLDDAEYWITASGNVCLESSYLKFKTNQPYPPINQSRYMVSYSTGLTDKNKAEIYSDDIVSMFGKTQHSAVFFEDGCFQIYIQCSGGHPVQKQLLINHINICEKAGSIFQNPELLEAKA